MKKVLIITDVDFWRKGAGHRSRVAALVKYLANHTKLTIIFAGEERPGDSMILNDQHIGYEFIYLERNGVLNQNGYVNRLKIFLKDYHPDVCIIEYLYLAFARQYLPKESMVILDTHDLVSEREKTFKAFGYEHEHITFADEIAVFKTFNKVMLIQDKEYAKVLNFMDKDKVLLVPHPVEYDKQLLRKKVSKIGFIGSEYFPNIDGIKWFLEKVFPSLDNQFELHVYGRVCYSLEGYKNYGIFLHGFIKSIETIFSEMDILINPVRFGAGLKIKNIEALGSGIPLITNSHGAAGIENQINKSFLIADDAPTFIEQLNYLAKNYKKRIALGNLGYQFIAKNFSPAKCFEPLIQAINI